MQPDDITYELSWEEANTLWNMFVAEKTISEHIASTVFNRISQGLRNEAQLKMFIEQTMNDYVPSKKDTIEFN